MNEILSDISRLLMFQYLFSLIYFIALSLSAKRNDFDHSRIASCVFAKDERNKMCLRFKKKTVYERLYLRAHMSAPVYTGPEEFIKYEICCEGKHGNACNMRCEIYIPNVCLLCAF